MSEKKRIAKPHRPLRPLTKTGGPAGSWIIEVPGGSGGGGGGGDIPAAPAVKIDPPAEVVFRGDHQVEVDVPWEKGATATVQNFTGVAIYLEDPDISSGANGPMDGGSVKLDGTSQMSGQWAPVKVGESLQSPAVVFVDTTMGGQLGTSYVKSREVRIYLASYGPAANAHLVRATDQPATPNIMVEIPLGRDQGESGMEWTFLCTNPRVSVTTDYNRPDPQYYLTFFYDPPDPATPVPPGLNHFGGVRIVFVYLDDKGNPLFPGTDTAIDVPVAQSQTGYKSPAYTPKSGGQQFRVYFCSEDDKQPKGGHINSLVAEVTPYAVVTVGALPVASDVTGFTISGQTEKYELDGSYIAEAKFSWTVPASDTRYSGLYLYRVNVTGGTPPLTTFPAVLPNGRQPTASGSAVVDLTPPSNDETWTIAAISVDVNGVLSDDPTKYGTPAFHSPTVTWNVGPPGAGGFGSEHAPMVTLNPGAAATPTQSMSSDGVGMVSFAVGSWTNPTDNAFAHAQIAMVVNNDPTKPTMWSVPANATSFTTPAIPSMGNIGATVPLDFYVLSDDPQDNKNSLDPNHTPKIHLDYVPSAGAVIPARSGWFDPDQFKWPAGGSFGADLAAQDIYVGKNLVVGGAPATFGGSDNGQIAVQNSSGQLRAWIGEQQPGQGSSAPLWGAWFGQLWVGGSSPLDAPFFIDNNGVIQVGGIAAAQGSSKYPYLSVRSDTGLEVGRIGAKISTQVAGDSNNLGGAPPPQLTSGAWFTQLAVGGSNLTNWNMLVVPDASNPLGSQFLMRNINKLQVDYAAKAGTPANQHYILEFGNSVWHAGSILGGTPQWQFPGIQIYEPDYSGGSAPNLVYFGATLINRGLVLRGTSNQSFDKLLSLVTYNGDPNGSDSANNYHFWGELSMFSPEVGTGGTRFMTVDIASGSAGNGSSFLYLRDVNNNVNFGVDQSGNVTIRGGLTLNSSLAATQYFVSPSTQVITTGGQFNGPGGVNTTGNISTSGQLAFKSLWIQGGSQVAYSTGGGAGGTSPYWGAEVRAVSDFVGGNQLGVYNDGRYGSSPGDPAGGTGTGWHTGGSGTFTTTDGKLVRVMGGCIVWIG